MCDNIPHNFILFRTKPTKSNQTNFGRTRDFLGTLFTNINSVENPTVIQKNRHTITHEYFEYTVIILITVYSMYSWVSVILLRPSPPIELPLNPSPTDQPRQTIPRLTSFYLLIANTTTFPHP